jgi:hypothetical protein
MKIVGLCGEPGTGKTSIVRELIGNKLNWREQKYGTLEYMEHLNNRVIILGKYDGEYFDGTDRLSMAVINDAESFLIARNTPATRVIFEGDRLWCPRFVGTLITLGADLLLYRVYCDMVQFIQRHTARREAGLVQDTKFINSRKTKYDNLVKQFPGLFTRKINSNLAQMSETVKEIETFLEWEY